VILEHNEKKGDDAEETYSRTAWHGTGVWWSVWLYNNNSSCYGVVFDRGGGERGGEGGGADDDVVDVVDFQLKCCFLVDYYFSSILLFGFFLLQSRVSSFSSLS